MKGVNPRFGNWIYVGMSQYYKKNADGFGIINPGDTFQSNTNISSRNGKWKSVTANV